MCDPFFDGESPIYTTVEHDSLGRVVRSVEANGVERLLDFNGLIRTSTNISSGGTRQSQITRRDVMDNIIRVTDNSGNSTRYDYDSLGNLIEMVDSDNNKTTIEYDSLSRKIYMDDPDKGVWRYTYNSLGQLITQTNARGETSCTSYDLLGAKNSPLRYIF